MGLVFHSIEGPGDVSNEGGEGGSRLIRIAPNCWASLRIRGETRGPEFRGMVKCCVGRESIETERLGSGGKREPEEGRIGIICQLAGRNIAPRLCYSTASRVM